MLNLCVSKSGSKLDLLLGIKNRFGRPVSCVVEFDCLVDARNSSKCGHSVNRRDAYMTVRGRQPSYAVAHRRSETLTTRWRQFEHEQDGNSLNSLRPAFGLSCLPVSS